MIVARSGPSERVACSIRLPPQVGLRIQMASKELKARHGHFTQRIPNSFRCQMEFSNPPLGRAAAPSACGGWPDQRTVPRRRVVLRAILPASVAGAPSASLNCGTLEIHGTAATLTSSASSRRVTRRGRLRRRRSVAYGGRSTSADRREQHQSPGHPTDDPGGRGRDRQLN